MSTPSPNFTGNEAPRTMEELRRDYQRQLSEYDRLAKTAIQTPTPQAIETVKQANMRVAAILERMISVIAQSRRQTGDLRAERDALMAKLRRIQEDYNGLVQDTDKLETLRRIREYETAKADKGLYTYLIIFLVGCLVLLLVIVMRSGSQTTSTAAPMPSNAAAIAPLT